MGELEYTVAEMMEYKPVAGWFIPEEKMIAALLWGVENDKDRIQVAEKVYGLTTRLDANKPYKKGRKKKDVVFYLIKSERIQKEKRKIEKKLDTSIKLKSIPRAKSAEEKRLEKWKAKFVKAAEEKKKKE